MILDRLAIITLNYNSFHDTSRQINDLLKEGIDNSSFFVVDNHSEDKEILEDFCKKNGLYFIASEKNGGYAFGNNLAIKKAILNGKNIFLLLNPDIEISKSTIETLYQTLLENNEIQIIGPRICDKNQRNLIYSDGGIILYRDKWDSHFNYGIIENEQTNQVPLNTEIDYVTGSALMFKKETLDKIGWMREDFFMYYEETEWCYRIKKYPNLKMGVLTRVKAFHRMSDKGEFYQYYTIRNRIWCYRLFGINIWWAVKKPFTKSFKSLFKKNNEPFSKKWNNFLLTTRAIINGLLKNIQ